MEENNIINIMSFILYYSNYCTFSRAIIQEISKMEIKKNIHFICIDNRITKPDSSIFIILPNQKEILFPSTIDKVPALMCLNRGSHTIFGGQIIPYLMNLKNNNNNEKINENPREPQTYNFEEINNYGVMSDNYSFLDQSIDSLSAKGDGGLRQLRNNVICGFNDNIETPPDNYVPNKIENTSIEKLQMERESALK